LLSQVNTPLELRQLAISDLPELCEQLRSFLQEKTQTKASHIKSSLGVTELTVALHYAYNTPEDVLIWDVGHQAYVHKLLTERKTVFHTNRKKGGLSGFTNRNEGVYDPFGAGHSSTALSATCGFAEAAVLSGEKRQHIAVVGDGAITGGMHFEAMNYAGGKQLNVTLIINHNGDSIDKNVGALHTKQDYEALCKAFNFCYEGRVSGHDIDALLSSFERLKTKSGPKLLVVDTQKGKGYATVNNPIVDTSNNFQKEAQATLLALAEKDERLVVVSPAMLSGAGFEKFKAKYPNRCFDTGITEQHAVTMSAALAAQGFTVFCHLYSTFAQRAYDQIIHDVALQKLPVRFLLDRAGLVGADGATHHGAFDLSFLNPIPNLSVSAPADEPSLAQLIKMAAKHKNGPFVIRYPKGAAVTRLSSNKPMALGKGRWINQEGKKLVISLGALPKNLLENIKEKSFAHYDWVFLKPFDERQALALSERFDEMVLIETGSKAGGLGETFSSFLAKHQQTPKIKTISLPDAFVAHGSNEELYKDVGFEL
jgi:1-deoxy-D-xylulose-5-phosphate synthase